MEFHNGACNTFQNENGKQVGLLCFGDYAANGQKSCLRYTNFVLPIDQNSTGLRFF